MFWKRKGEWYLYGANDKLSLNYLETNYGKDFIIQEFLEQHESINHFCPTSVNTLRLTLYRSVKDDKCVVPSAIMRIGNMGSVVDNAHAGGCFVGIDIEMVIWWIVFLTNMVEDTELLIILILACNNKYHMIYG